jgi:uncharacterized membrane protein (DUF485 family)
MEIPLIAEEQYLSIARGESGVRSVVLVVGEDDADTVMAFSSEFIQKANQLGYGVRLHLMKFPGRSASVLITGEWGSVAVPRKIGDHSWQYATSVLEKLEVAPNPVRIINEVKQYVLQVGAQNVANRDDVESVFNCRVSKRAERNEFVVILACPSAEHSDLFFFRSPFDPIALKSLPFDRVEIANGKEIKIQSVGDGRDLFQISFTSSEITHTFVVDNFGFEQFCLAGGMLKWKLKFADRDSAKKATIVLPKSVASQIGASVPSIQYSSARVSAIQDLDDKLYFGRRWSYRNPFWTDNHDWARDPVACRAVEVLPIVTRQRRKRQICAVLFIVVYLVFLCSLGFAWLNTQDENNNGGEQFGIPFGITFAAMFPVFVFLSFWWDRPMRIYNRLGPEAHRESIGRFLEWRGGLRETNPGRYVQILNWEEDERARKIAARASRGPSAVESYARQTAENTAAIRSKLS